VIIRVLGEGQYSVADEHAELLNGLDSGLEQAVATGDDAAFRTALTDLLAQVRTVGEPLPDDSLEPSDAVLPDESSTLAEVKALLAETSEGLIPG
jgi:hypothetical protein